MIEAFGWSDTLRQNFAPFAARGLMPARVMVQQRGIFGLISNEGEIAGKIAGRLAHTLAPGDHPVAGDWVGLATRPREGTAMIQAILPRRTVFSRQAAGGRHIQHVVANVDIALLVTSMNAEFNPRRLERYLATSWTSGARAVIVLTKADLCANAADYVAQAQDIAFGTPIIPVSATTGAGLDSLAALLQPRETCVLLGSSGVGKSTLVNALANAAIMKTGAIRAGDSRGRHTTTHKELLLLPNGTLLLDTPGMRELGLACNDSGLAAAFDDIEALARSCRFHNCRHGGEPGCAVQAALDTGALEAARWASFRKLQRELAFAERKEDRHLQAAEHKRWAARTRAQRAGKKLRAKE